MSSSRTPLQSLDDPRLWERVVEDPDTGCWNCNRATARGVAELYGIHPEHVTALCSRRFWKHDNPAAV